MTIICAEKEATSRAQGSSAESLTQYPCWNLGYLLTTPRGGCNELIGKKSLWLIFLDHSSGTRMCNEIEVFKHKLQVAALEYLNDLE